MKIKTLVSPVYLFLLIILFAVTSLADNVRLKNGTVVKGKVVSFAGGSFTVVTEPGLKSRVIDMRDVDTIEFDGHSEDRDPGTASTPLRTPIGNNAGNNEPDDDTTSQTSAPPDRASPGSTAPSATANPINRPAPVNRPASSNSSSNAWELVATVLGSDDWTFVHLIIRCW